MRLFKLAFTHNTFAFTDIVTLQNVHRLHCAHKKIEIKSIQLQVRSESPAHLRELSSIHHTFIMRAYKS